MPTNRYKLCTVTFRTSYFLAPPPGIEPGTFRLTVERSAAELQGNKVTILLTRTVTITGVQNLKGSNRVTEGT